LCVVLPCGVALPAALRAQVPASAPQGTAPEVPDLFSPAAVLYADGLVGRAQYRGDALGLSLFIAEEFGGWSRDGRPFTRDDVLRAVDGFRGYASWEQREQQVIFHDSTAFVFGLLELRYRGAPGTASVRTRYVRHYVPRGGRWQLLSSLLLADP
jgi:hypothetical protein